MHHAKLVVTAQPCSACQITTDLITETMGCVCKLRSDFDYEIVVIGHPRELARVEGIEVEMLPAVLLDGEQISAGTVVAPRQILKMLDLMELTVA
jgi:hypothetical protein